MKNVVILHFCEDELSSCLSEYRTCICIGTSSVFENVLVLCLNAKYELLHLLLSCNLNMNGWNVKEWCNKWYFSRASHLECVSNSSNTTTYTVVSTATRRPKIGFEYPNETGVSPNITAQVKTNANILQNLFSASWWSCRKESVGVLTVLSVNTWYKIVVRHPIERPPDMGYKRTAYKTRINTTNIMRDKNAIASNPLFRSFRLCQNLNITFLLDERFGVNDFLRYTVGEDLPLSIYRIVDLRRWVVFSL